MRQYTLRELCEECGVTRRAVQWFERYGLVSPCGKTKRAYLLYDEKAVEKVKKIKLLQNFGFSVSEIAEYFAGGADARRRALLQKSEKLKEKQREIASNVEEIEKLIKQYK